MQEPDPMPHPSDLQRARKLRRWRDRHGLAPGQSPAERVADRVRAGLLVRKAEALAERAPHLAELASQIAELRRRRL